jgi:hypothetical protein
MRDVAAHVGWMLGKSGRGAPVRYRLRGRAHASHAALHAALFGAPHDLASLAALVRGLLVEPTGGRV